MTSMYKAGIAVALVVSLLALTFALRNIRAAASADLACRGIEQEIQKLQSKHARAQDETRVLEQANAARVNIEVDPANRRNAPDVTTADPTLTPETKAARKANRAAVIAEMAIQQRVSRLIRLETRLRPRFEQLGLSAAQWKEYQTLRLEFANEGIAPPQMKPGEVQPLHDVALRARDVFEKKVRDLIGDDAFAELQRLQAPVNDPLRDATRALENALMWSSTPLESRQAEQLAQLLEPHRDDVIKPGGIVVDESIIAQAGAILSQPQIAAWRRLQAEAEALRGLKELNRKQQAAMRSEMPQR